MTQRIRYLRGEMGSPYAMRGNRIAGYSGHKKGRRIFYVESVKDFEAIRFSTSRLTPAEDIPTEIKNGLEKVLA